jgi:osmotically inducible lipoprotein OsmB
MASCTAVLSQRRGVLMSLLLLLLASCSRPLTTREKGTVVGGSVGAATGAVLGATAGAPSAGAAVGGAAGAAGGAWVGDRLQALNHQFRAQQRQTEQRRRELKRQEVEAKHPLLRQRNSEQLRPKSQDQQTEQGRTQ